MGERKRKNERERKKEREKRREGIRYRIVTHSIHSSTTQPSFVACNDRVTKVEKIVVEEERNHISFHFIPVTVS